MRVMIVGDTHGDVEWCADLTRIAARHGAERILQVGDFGYWPRMTTRSGRSHADFFLTRLSRTCDKYGVDEWIVIDGNHDDHQSLADLMAVDTADSDGMYRLGERVRYSPRGNVFDLGGQRFATLGGAASIDALLEEAGVDFGGHPYRKGWNWFPGLEEPSVHQAEELVRKGTVDVLLTHEAPTWPDLGDKGIKGVYIPPEIEARCRFVRSLVTTVALALQPKLFVHGHWHYRYSAEYNLHGGLECRVEGLAHNGVNGGRDRRAYIFVDLPELTVTDGRKQDTLLNSRTT